MISLHPLTIKSLRKSHPWVTADSYSNNFAKNQFLLELRDPQTKESFGQFLHDPNHPTIKARFWGKSHSSFEDELVRRIEHAVQKRLCLLTERENIVLAYAEADALPGLFITKVGTALLLQFHAFYWEAHLEKVIKALRPFFNQFNIQSAWTQKRIPGSNKKPPQFHGGNQKTEFSINEMDRLFQIKMNQGHDIGIYTDMAEIRKQLSCFVKAKGTMLNLFSYTGAFSLLGLSRNSQVTSVDVSRKYMNWCYENIELNGFDKVLHRPLVNSSVKAIEKLSSEGHQFDFIISDPPSFSSDGKKKMSSFDFYEKKLIQLSELCASEGYMALFLNTHKIKRESFAELINQKLVKRGKFIIKKQLSTSRDCPLLPNFPEGDIVKGILLQRIKA